MKEVAYLLIITIIILGFIAGDIIPLFRESMNVIQGIAQKEYKNQKIKTAVLLPLDKNTVMGSDVIAVIRYYHNDSNVTIEVTIGGKTEVYVNDNYEAQQFSIPHEVKFDCTYEYNGEFLSKATYIESNN